MATSYTAVIQQRGPWWIGWIEELAGVNSQAATRAELLENLQSALQEALEMNRADSGQLPWRQIPHDINHPHHSQL